MCVCECECVCWGVCSVTFLPEGGAIFLLLSGQCGDLQESTAFPRLGSSATAS